MRVHPKIRVLFSGTLDLENFATASRWCIGEVNKTRWRSSLQITPTVVERIFSLNLYGRAHRGWMRKVYYTCTLVDSNRLTPLRRFVLDLLYKLFLRCCTVIALPSVLWRCWLGGRKSIGTVKNWVVGWWRDYLSGTRCRLAYGPAVATATHCLLLQLNPDWFYLCGTGSPG